MLFCHLWIFFFNFSKNLSGIPSECQSLDPDQADKNCLDRSVSKLFANLISRRQKLPLAGKELKMSLVSGGLVMHLTKATPLKCEQMQTTQKNLGVMVLLNYNLLPNSLKVASFKKGCRYFNGTGNPFLKSYS